MMLLMMMLLLLLLLMMMMMMVSGSDGASISSMHEFFNNESVTDGVSFDRALESFVKAKTSLGKQIFFASLGCSTMDPEVEGRDDAGKNRDPFIMYKLSATFSGVFVEASPFLLKQMVANVRRLRGEKDVDRLHFINGAVGCGEGVANVSFFSASEEYTKTCLDCPPWVKYEKGSMNIKALDWRIPREFIAEDVVPCWNINDILELNKRRAHFLFIDVEGVEFDVIRQLAPSNRPHVIVYEDKEHHHAPRDAKAESRWLAENGYFSVRYDDENMAAIQSMK
jgi:FkbM family methyltransferase